MIKKISNLKYPFFLSNFNKTFIFLDIFPKTLKNQISRKSVQWESSCFMRTDRRTGMSKLAVAFRNFANASKNVQKIIVPYNMRTLGQKQSMCTANEIRRLLSFYECSAVILNVDRTVPGVSTVYSVLNVSLHVIFIFCCCH